MRTRDSKLFKFILEFTQIMLVFLGVYSALMCAVTSLDMNYERWIVTVVMLIATFVFYGLFSVLETFHNGKLYGILGITVFFVVIGVRFKDAMQKGIVSAVNNFLKGFMNYAGADTSLIAYKDTGGYSIKFCTNLLLILLGVYLTAIVSAFFYRKRRSKVFVMVTLPFVIIPLIVGKLGTFANLFTYLIVAMTIIGTRHLRMDATDRRMRQKLAILLMFMGLVCGGISYLIVPPQKYEDNRERLEQAQNSIVALTSWSGEDAVTWLKSYFSGDAISYGKLGKKKEIIYTGKTIMKLSGKFNTENGMYLKGFVGDRYEDNRWSSLAKEENYQKDMKKLDSTGVTLENWHAQLRNELGDREKSQISDIWETGNIRVRNLAFGYGNYVVPYLPTAGFKSQEDGKMAVENTGIDYEMEYYAYYPVVMRQDVSHPRYRSANRMADAAFWEENKEERKQLKEMAEKYYLQVPDSLSALCEEFNQHLARRNPGKIYPNQIIAEAKQYITRDTKYSLAPGKTPSGKETVEYFLKEGKKGYCTYYATTAAILLRGAGIPTRYVEGVYIPRERIAESVEKGEEIEILDENAHAWIEVFDDKYGFVPVEVTPGRGEDEPVESQRENGNSSDNAQQGGEAESDDDSDADDNMEVATPTPVVSEKPEENMTFEDIDKKDDKQKSSDKGNPDQTEHSVMKDILAIALRIFIVLLLFVLVMEIQRRVRKKIFVRNMRSLRAKRRIRMAYHHLVPVFATRGVFYRGQDMAEYTAQIAEVMDLPEEILVTFVELLFHARFGPDDIGEEELHAFGERYHLIRMKTYEDVKFLRKLYYMYIMVL